MEQIEQLKAMRDAAKARLEAMPDYRLMNSLGSLIDDLEDAFGLKPAAAVPVAAVVAAEPVLEAAIESVPEVAVADESDLAEVEAEAAEPVVEAAPEAEDVLDEVLVVVASVEPEVAIDADDLVAAINQEMSDETLVEAIEMVEIVEVTEMVETMEVAPEEIVEATMEAPAQTNGHSNGFHAAESEEDAVSRALDELSADLADVGGPAETQPSVLTFPTN